MYNTRNLPSLVKAGHILATNLLSRYYENMPAKEGPRPNKSFVYSHIYNSGIGKELIFNDKEDYTTFIGYLEQYLSPANKTDDIKKAFTVRGRTFKGTPHQPKNYFDQVELVAYSLTPTHFHLILQQLTEDALQHFMRSLCTRYSIYYNKKYQRSGPLFSGAYKSNKMDTMPQLLQLTRKFHFYAQSKSKKDYSSYPEYLKLRETPWIKAESLLAIFSNPTNGFLKKTPSYKMYVETYKPSEDDTKLFEKMVTETSKPSKVKKENPAFVKTSFVDTTTKRQTTKPNLRFPELGVLAGVFLVLFTLGFNNIQTSTAEEKSPTPMVTPIVTQDTPSISGVHDEKLNEKPKIILTIKIDDGAESVNIRQEPTIDSKKVGSARAGDTFEYISLDSGWYGVKLDDGSKAYISEMYLGVLEITE